MFLTIRPLLAPEEAARLQAISQGMKFVDGRLTNAVRPAKHNPQAPRDPNEALDAKSVKIASAAYMRSSRFPSSWRPATRWSIPRPGCMGWPRWKRRI